MDEHNFPISLQPYLPFQPPFDVQFFIIPIMSLLGNCKQNSFPSSTALSFGMN
jgi:hypothetical protein